MALTKILEGGIADDAVGNTKLDLSENYAFTGTVTGAGGGKVLQAVSSGIVNSSFSTTSGSYQTTSCDVNITPSSTSSKILVFANVTGYYIYGGGTDHGGSGAIYRASTELYGSNKRFGYQRDTSSGSLEIAIPCVLQHLDSPSTTSQITYGIYMSAHAGGTVWTNNHDRSIIALEISA